MIADRQYAIIDGYDPKTSSHPVIWIITGIASDEDSKRICTRTGCGRKQLNEQQAEKLRAALSGKDYIPLKLLEELN